jgi:hypothetical protein
VGARSEASPALVRPVKLVGPREQEVGVGGHVEVLRLNPLRRDMEMRLQNTMSPSSSNKYVTNVENKRRKSHAQITDK